MADGREKPFDQVTSAEQGEKRHAQGKLLSDTAADLAERNPQKRLGVYGKAGRFVKDGVEQLRETGGLQHHPDVRGLAQAYSGQSEAKAAWGPQKSGVVGKAAEAVTGVADAVNGARRSGHKAPAKVNLDAVKQAQQPRGRGL